MISIFHKYINIIYFLLILEESLPEGSQEGDLINLFTYLFTFAQSILE